MYQGGCLCGAVRFEIYGPISNAVYCHCTQCHKAQGSAFAANGVVKAADFRILHGTRSLSTYESSPGKKRCFCICCGSPILSARDDAPDVLRVRLGVIDNDLEQGPCAHVFVGAKANGYPISDGLPQYEGYEPGR